MSAALASVLVLFLAPAPARSIPTESNAFERELASVPQLSIGVLSATQGAYSPAQLVLDMSQGARVSPSAYASSTPPALALVPQNATSTHRAPGKGQVQGWSQVQPWGQVLHRADGAPQLLEPGLLAQQIPGGAAYVPSRSGGSTDVDGALAADRGGRVSEAWPASSNSAGAIQSALARHRLVVADLPSGTSGQAELRALVSKRSPRELLIVVQRAETPGLPNDSTAGQQGRELLWIGLAGLGGGRTLTSQTTNQPGMVAAIDVAPTILRHLGLTVPADMRGEPMRLEGSFDGSYLRGLKARLGVIPGRRLPALGWLLIAWALLLGGMRLAGAALAEGRPARALEKWALRVGGLALLWCPVAVLVTAALEPSRAAEIGLLVLICFGLAALADRLVRWPRALLVPAIAAVVAIVADALAHTQLLMRSLLGPDPQFGARFYGIGNELKSGLAVLVLCAVAAALYPAVRGRRAALSMALAGILLAVVEGSARIGAGVGAVILVSAGAAVATVMLLPGALSRRRALLVLAAPAVGLVALAAIDLATAHGGGHFTGSILHARSAGDLRDVIVRRYGAAWDELRNHLMPLATALALGAGVLIVRGRQRLCSPLGGDPAWVAALCGGFAAGLIGALSEDSGPVLLVVAVGALGCVLAYVWGKPSERDTSARRLTESTARVSVSKS